MSKSNYFTVCTIHINTIKKVADRSKGGVTLQRQRFR